MVGAQFLSLLLVIIEIKCRDQISASISSGVGELTCFTILYNFYNFYKMFPCAIQWVTVVRSKLLQI